jgi:diketogulonate reductase-like aldo/keto reductase
MELTIESCATLNNGVKIPYLGFGTYLLGTGRITQSAILHALLAGYRHIDTAKFYRNERDISIAIKQTDIPREEIFITTKLWNNDQGYDRTIAACEQSLEQLETDYIDLFLMHWPVTDIRLETWRAMEKLFDDGKCRAIGVSNFTIKHLEELLENSSIVPTVNQVEFHPFLYQKKLLDYCRDNGIQLESYSPLTKGRKLNEPVLAPIAEHYGKTPAQILIRWALEQLVVTIPKSQNRERIRENADVFDFSISPEDMTVLNVLNENFRSSWDPTFVV